MSENSGPSGKRYTPSGFPDFEMIPVDDWVRFDWRGCWPDEDPRSVPGLFAYVEGSRREIAGFLRTNVAGHCFDENNLTGEPAAINRYASLVHNTRNCLKYLGIRDYPTWPSSVESGAEASDYADAISNWVFGLSREQTTASPVEGKKTAKSTVNTRMDDDDSGGGRGRPSEIKRDLELLNDWETNGHKFGSQAKFAESKGMSAAAFSAALQRAREAKKTSNQLRPR